MMPGAKHLHGTATQLETVGAGQRRRGAVLSERRLAARKTIEPYGAGRLRTRHVPVFDAGALAGAREPVVEERGVLAAVDRPEECIADGLAAERGVAVARHQEAGGATVFLNRDSRTTGARTVGRP